MSSVLDSYLLETTWAAPKSVGVTWAPPKSVGVWGLLLRKSQPKGLGLTPKSPSQSGFGRLGGAEPRPVWVLGGAEPRPPRPSR